MSKVPDSRVNLVTPESTVYPLDRVSCISWQGWVSQERYEN